MELIKLEPKYAASMNRNQSLNVISVLLAIIALGMIWLGSMAGMAPPILTGVGFFLIVWALQVLK